MSVAIIRYLKKSEQDAALALVRLLGDLTIDSVRAADPRLFCSRDQEFVDRLKYLTDADPSILGRIRITRAKLLRGLRVLSHEWEELILSLNLKGFYDSGLDLSYATLHGSVDLRGAVIGGDYDASHSVVLGDCNEQKLLVLGSIIEDGRTVRGEHLIGAQTKLDDHSEPKSVPRPDASYEVDLSELDEEVRVTASGDRISLGIRVNVDLSGLVATDPPDSLDEQRRFPSDATTLRSVTPEQLELWRRARFGPAAQPGRRVRGDPDVSVVRIAGEEQRPPDLTVPDLLTAEDIISPPRRLLKPPPKPRVFLSDNRRAKYLAEKQVRPLPKPRRDSLRPRPEPPTPAPAKRTKRGPSRGQRPMVSLRTIDRGWDD